MTRLTLPLAAAVASLLAADPARADGLTVTTRELGTWNDALAQLRADLGSEGRTLHVQVLDHGAAVACDRYRVELDAAGREAFRTGTCDPGSDETELTLADRAALFDRRGHVPLPRTIAVSAILRATAVASGGPEGGSLVRCTVAVRPYLDDLLHGTRVLLTPDHFALRPGSAQVSVSPDPGGWTLGTTAQASVRVAYEVVDLATGDVVLRQDTTIACGPVPPPADPAPRPAPPPAVVPRSRVADPIPALPPPPSGRSQCATLSGIVSCTEAAKQAAIFGAVGLGSVGLAAYSMYAYTEAPPKANLALPVTGFVVGAVAGVLLSVVGGVYFYSAANPLGSNPSRRRKAALTPTLAVTGRETTFGLAGGF
jgi:hypothetical protein